MLANHFKTETLLKELLKRLSRDEYARNKALLDRLAFEIGAEQQDAGGL